MTARRQLFRIAAIVLFVLLGLQELWSASDQLTTSESVGKAVQTAALIAYGLSGLWIAISVHLTKARQRTMEVLWCVGWCWQRAWRPPSGDTLRSSPA